MKIFHYITSLPRLISPVKFFLLFFKKMTREHLLPCLFFLQPEINFPAQFLMISGQFPVHFRRYFLPICLF